MSDFKLWLEEGVKHILTPSALDHILYLLALCACFSITDWKKVVVLITAFTIGHSITLFLTAFEYISINTPLVEFCIPLTIASTAIINIVQKENNSQRIRFLYILALFFGFIHGMAYGANSIGSLYTGKEAVINVLGFNIGIELAQLLIVFSTLTLTYFLLTIIKINKNYWRIGISSIILVYAVYLSFQNFPK
jgi:hydrogenase/urease accessory protein HupE